MLNKDILSKMEDIINYEGRNMTPEVLITMLHCLANLCSLYEGCIPVLRSGLLKRLIEVYIQSDSWSQEVEYHYTWLFSNLLYVSDVMSFEEETDLIVLVGKIFLKYPYNVCPELDSEAFWSIHCYLKRGNHMVERVANIEKGGIFQKLIQIANEMALKGTDIGLVKPVISSIGCLFSLNDDLIEKYLDLMLASTIIRISKTQFLSVSQDAFWIIGNIMASKQEQINLIATSELFDWLGESLTIGSGRIKFECAHILKNYFSHSTEDHIENTLRNHRKVKLL